LAAQVGNQAHRGQAGKTQVENQRVRFLAGLGQGQHRGQVAGLFQQGVGQQALEGAQHAITDCP